MKILIPGTLVVIAVQIVMNNYHTQQKMRDLAILKKENKKETIPIRMQAYERLILFLERIHPDRLVMRINKPGLSGRDLHLEMLRTIRKEYEHNLAQQLYVSEEAWKLVAFAKEEIVKIINITASGIKENSSSGDWTAALLKATSSLEKMPSDVAISGLKKEFREQFG